MTGMGRPLPLWRLILAHAAVSAITNSYTTFVPLVTSRQDE